MLPSSMSELLKLGWECVAVDAERHPLCLSRYRYPGACAGFAGKLQIRDGSRHSANSWENNGVGPGGANNRQFVLPTVATNLPVDYFNNLFNFGPLDISGSGAQSMLSWPYGANPNNTIRLQSSTNPASGWSDVPHTEGQGLATVDSSSNAAYFRLIGP